MLSLISTDTRSTWLDSICFANLVSFALCKPDTGIIEIASAAPNKLDYSPRLAAFNTRIMTAVGVGGGSLVNNAETFPPTRRMWEMAYDLGEMPYLDNVWNELARTYFDRALSVLQPEYIPDDILASDHYAIAREHIDIMTRAGYPMGDGSDDSLDRQSSHTPMIVDWDMVREEMNGARTPSIIRGEVWLGTNSGAKKSLDKEYSYLGLPDLNEHVGTRWVNNGNSATFRTKSVNPQSNGMGGPASIKTYDFTDPAAPVNIQMLPMRIPQLAQLAGLEIFTIALGVPQGEGRFTFDAATSTVQLHWPKDGSRNVYDRFLEIMRSIDPFGQHLPLPAEVGQGVTLHPLGCMPLGLATDEHCRVKGYSHLYAVDGSIIPGPSLANPSLLIAAMAERCMDTAVRDILAHQQTGTRAAARRAGCPACPYSTPPVEIPVRAPI